MTDRDGAPQGPESLTPLQEAINTQPHYEVRTLRPTEEMVVDIDPTVFMNRSLDRTDTIVQTLQAVVEAGHETLPL